MSSRLAIKARNLAKHPIEPFFVPWPHQAKLRRSLVNAAAFCQGLFCFTSAWTTNQPEQVSTRYWAIRMAVLITFSRLRVRVHHELHFP
jgi:hypothetical protein